MPQRGWFTEQDSIPLIWSILAKNSGINDIISYVILVAGYFCILIESHGYRIGSIIQTMYVHVVAFGLHSYVRKNELFVYSLLRNTDRILNAVIHVEYIQY